MPDDPRERLYWMLGPGLIEFSFRWTGDDEVPAALCTGVMVPWSSHRAVVRNMGIQEAMIGLTPRRGNGGFEETRAIWARLESKKHADQLRRFRPCPTLVLREGKSVKRTAIWALSHPLNLIYSEQANRRVAHRLGTPKKHAAPRFMCFAPTCLLSTGQRTIAEFMTDNSYHPRQVVGHLRDAPDPNAWRQAKEAA